MKIWKYRILRENAAPCQFEEPFHWFQIFKVLTLGPVTQTFRTGLLKQELNLKMQRCKQCKYFFSRFSLAMNYVYFFFNIVPACCINKQKGPHISHSHT